MTLEENLIEFIINAPFNRTRLAIECGVHENNLKLSFMKERGLPKTHLAQILCVCTKYGFKFSTQDDIANDNELSRLKNILDNSVSKDLYDMTVKSLEQVKYELESEAEGYKMLDAELKEQERDGYR